MIDIYDAKEYAKTISTRIGFAFFALVMIAVIFSLGQVPAFQWWLMSGMVGFLAHSVAYAYIFAINTKEPELEPPLQAQQPTIDRRAAQPLQQQQTQPVRAESRVSVQNAVVQDSLESLWGNGLFRVAGGGMIPIPDDVSVDHLRAIKLAVREGKLKTGMSPTKLDGMKIVSRHTDEPNAYTVVDFLVEAGILRDNGERKMYTWTDSGRRIFGVASPTPSSAYSNVDFSGAPEVATTPLD